MRWQQMWRTVNFNEMLLLFLSLITMLFDLDRIWGLRFYFLCFISAHPWKIRGPLFCIAVKSWEYQRGFFFFLQPCLLSWIDGSVFFTFAFFMFQHRPRRSGEPCWSLLNVPFGLVVFSILIPYCAGFFNTGQLYYFYLFLHVICENL